MNKTLKLKDGREFVATNGTFIPGKDEIVYFVRINTNNKKVQVEKFCAAFDHTELNRLSSFNFFKTEEDAEKTAALGG